MAAYESREEALEEARAIAGDGFVEHFKYELACLYQTSEAKDSEPAARHASKVLDLQREAPDAGSPEAQAAIAVLEQRAQELWGRAVADLIEGPAAPLLLPTEVARYDLVRAMLRRSSGYQDIPARAWAYAAIGLGAERPPVVSTVNAAEGRDLKTEWGIRCSQWGRAKAVVAEARGYPPPRRPDGSD